MSCNVQTKVCLVHIVTEIFAVYCGLVQILTEIAGETLQQMAAAPKNKAAPSRVAAAAEEDDEAADAEAEDLQARLNAIRS